MWKKTKSKILLRHSRLKVLEDDVVLPDGTSTKYLKFAKTHDSVTVICQREDQKFLLLSEYSYPPNKWLLEFPGGSIKLKEKPKFAANRELMEEGKYYAKKLKFIGKYYINNRRSSAQMYVYHARELEYKSLPKDHEEAFKYKWYKTNQIDEMIRENQITNCHILASWSLFKNKLQNPSN
ncbi:NUDIX hydrolase [Patescibacteria group bacterium]|nr:NUDIX hydrolase [Patescibacteria group bacterium]MCG2702166.1 NUDIX hydrolase [Candidatus Parcubacteria bacterium]MBU4209863.1 NUDIX hydrolase [Patescibacteria group bacterium]MBU4265350.1 NUDIX hydrolase [Patescibacteria group bacterium]MBU4390790.1 NUDIX hydrolase [Patescibacteria group bacterium]